MAYTTEQFAALKAAQAKAEDLVSSLRVVIDLSEPTKVQGVSASATDSTATIIWVAAEGAPRITSYNVYRGATLVGATVSTNFVETSVANGTYVYAIEAVDGNGRTGDRGSANSIIVSVAPPKPDVMGTFRASAVNTSTIAVTWVVPSGGTPPTSYQVSRSLTGSSAQDSTASGWTQIFNALGTSVNSTGLTASTQYFYRGRSLASGVPSDGYATANARTLSIPASTGVTFPTRNSHSGGATWASGVGETYTASRYNGWRDWAGRIPDVGVAWAGAQYMNSWARIRTGGSTGKFDACLSVFPTTTHIIHRFPMWPNDPATRNDDFANPAIWDSLASGEHDADFDAAFAAMKTMATNAGRTGADKRIGLSLGWEVNGWWYAYTLSTSKLAQYKTAFKNISDIFRSHFPFGPVDWPPARTYGGDNQTLTLEDMVPDPSSFDVISRSLHDDNPSTTDETSWELQYNPPLSRKLIGLKQVEDLAIQLNKKIGLSEWGVNLRAGSTCNDISERPDFFLQKVFDEFLVPNASRIAWDAYFNTSCTSLYNATASDLHGIAARNAYDVRWNP
jgi:hypothetical protein